MKARGLIFGTRILLHIPVFVCASMCEFRGRNSIKRGGGGRVGNRKFYRSRMTKQTSLLNSSREI